MDYTVEDVSPVEKKVSVTITPEEVDAALTAAAVVYQGQAQLDGFRKGKAPLKVVEKRFHNQISKEAHDDLLNVHLNEIFRKLDVTPVSGIKMKGGDRPLQKGQPYEYSMEFEIMPKFELPPYEGLEVEQTSPAPTPEAVASLLEKLRRDKAQIVPVSGDAPGKDGQIVNLDFEFFEDGRPLTDLKTNNFEIELGRHEALPAFEDFVKDIPVGHTAEREIQFPDDFVSKDMAGKKLLAKVTVHAVKERKLPEVNENFLKSYGHDSLENLNKSLAEAYAKGVAGLYEAEAQKKLLDAIVRQTDFALPPSMLDTERTFLAMDRYERLARAGKRAYDDEKGAREFVNSFTPAAENRTREKIILLTIAKKENLEVGQKELEREIVSAALRMGQEPQKYYDDLQKSGMIFQLRDNMLCDKAMDLVYARARVTMVPEKPAEAENIASAITSTSESQEECKPINKEDE